MELMRRMSMYALRHISCTCASILMSYVKWNPTFFSVVENDMTLCPNEREVRLKFCVHLFGRIRRHSVFFIIQLELVFNHPIFDIRNACFHRRNSDMNLLGKNRGLDLNVISKQVDTQRMSFD